MFQRDKSFLTQLPNELYYSILDFLGEEDETQQASLALLNVALSGYGHSKFVSAWCDQKVEADLTALNSLEQINIIPRSRYRRTGLAVLCKSVAGICATCNNRATRRERDEFLNLRLCHACTPRYSPKISDERGEIYFNGWSKVASSQLRHVCVQFEGYEFINGTRLIQRPHKVYSWWEIKELFNKGVIFPKVYRTLPEDQLLEVEGESYGEFHNWRGVGHNTTISSSPGLLWNQFQSRWGLSYMTESSALAIDMAFFKEFRYRFDPSWRPMSSHDELQIYGNIMRYWAFESGIWGCRPWCPERFPAQPHWWIVMAYDTPGLTVTGQSASCRIL